MTIAPWRKPGSASSPRSVPSRRRHLHPQLEAHGATLLYDTSSVLTEEAVPVGITLAGWSIGTSQGPIGDSQWFDQALKRLEPLSQPAGDACLEDQNPDSSGGEQHQLRQLALPEMVFPLAHVVLEYQGRVILSFNAMDFLQDWSTAHQYIPLPGYPPKSFEGNENDDAIHHVDNDNIKDDIPMPSFRGVQVLQTSDASLWKQKTKSIQTNGAPSQDTIRSTTFHYDWTYSSPYTGTFHLPRDCHYTNDADGNGGDDEDDDKAGNIDVPKWMSLPVSGMPMHLLTDQTIPILLFDQLVFVEDDLHDNGQMQYTIKVRVMPQCAYLLCQLFVRVDHVVIRVRETRWLIEFKNGPTSNGYIQPPVLYRDVTWRECRWDDLIHHGLPNHVQAWTQNEAYAPPEAMAALAKLIQKLPVVPLPKDVPPFAQINLV